MLLRDVEVEGDRLDLRFDTRVRDLGRCLAPLTDEEVVDGNGGAVIPGLHDHHLHLLALAATSHSITARTLDELGAALAASLRSGWVRVVGFVEEVDRFALDRISFGHPLRVQHRSGALWVLNSTALDAIGLAGHPDGKFWRQDVELGERLRAADATSPPDLAWVGRELGRLGITGVTDATPELDESARRLLALAGESGALPQEIHFLSPGKLVVGDHTLPALDELIASIGEIHGSNRAAALHCVTRESLALSIAALREAGVRNGDRIEHGSVMDETTCGVLAELRVAVVTQPGFIADRGDDYLRDVAPEDHPDLYRYASLLASGATVVPSSDAPFGPLDPWEVINAANRRRTPSGKTVGAVEQVSPRVALDGYLRAPTDLHGSPRRVSIGAPADLVVLDQGLEGVLSSPSADHVRATWRAGVRISP